MAYIKTNRNEPARELLNAIIQKNSDNALAWRYLGYCYLKLEDKDNAVASYIKAVQVDDTDWDAHRGLGVAYIFKGMNGDGTVDEQMKAKAIEQWNKSLKIKPDQPNADRLVKLIKGYSE
jgi:tetratricopeptide (TPR) repeat protein